jgi:hypothetical protein
MVRERERLLRYGRQVPANVVEVKPRIASSESGSRAVGAIVTVSFVDLAKVQHWVARRTPDAGITTGAANPISASARLMIGSPRLTEVFVGPDPLTSCDRHAVVAGSKVVVRLAGADTLKGSS